MIRFYSPIEKKVIKEKINLTDFEKVLMVILVVKMIQIG